MHTIPFWWCYWRSRWGRNPVSDPLIVFIDTRSHYKWYSNEIFIQNIMQNNDTRSLPLRRIFKWDIHPKQHAKQWYTIIAITQDISDEDTKKQYTKQWYTITAITYKAQCVYDCGICGIYEIPDIRYTIVCITGVHIGQCTLPDIWYTIICITVTHHPQTHDTRSCALREWIRNTIPFKSTINHSTFIQS